MSNYVITRQQLKKRFADGGASEKESAFIINAIFSYLEKVSETTAVIPFQQKIIDLVFYDFRFLYSLYTNDEFARKFFSVLRDVQNSTITFSDIANENDRIIRESTGLGDGVNGLYLYILTFDRHVMDSVVSLAESYSINNPGESIFSQTNGKVTVPLFGTAAVVPRTDDRKSYTDSVMSITPKVIDLDSTSVLPDDYKHKDSLNYELPFLNGKPGTDSMSRINTSEAGVISSSKKTTFKSSVNDSVVKPSSKYPVLNFILNASRN